MRRKSNMNRFSRTSIGVCILLTAATSSVAWPKQTHSATSGVARSPRTVTSKLENTTLRDALLLIAKQTGSVIEVDSRSLAGSVLSLDLTGLTFWQAVDRIAAATDSHVELYGLSGMPVLAKKRSATMAPRSYDGFFRCTLTKTSATRDLESAKSACAAHLEVAWEPRLEPLFLETRPRDLVVKDERGHVIHVPSEGSVFAPVDGKLALAIEVPLPALPRSMAKIGSLTGKLMAIAPTEMATLSFDKLSRLAAAQAGSAERRRGAHGMTCTLTKVDILSDRVSVQVRLELPPGGPTLESYQSWVVNNEMQLQNKDGAKRTPKNYSLDSSTARGAVLSYHFTDKDVLKQPGDWTVTYRTPAGLVEIPFGFSFKDVPLP